ncbi:MAG: nitroreductase family protein [Antricoccus sp.]
MASATAALEVAVRAPSIHNTQPWRWRLGHHGLDLVADRTRQLAVADPDGHSLLISCGAALHLTELALRLDGWRIETTYFPDPDDPDLLARFHPTGRDPADPVLAEEVDAARRRQSDRRPFAAGPVSPQERETLRAAGSDSHAWVDFPDRLDRQVELAVAVSWADRAQRKDEAYLAEMRHWLRDPDVHTFLDGVPADAFPHVPADHPRHTDVPLRDFEVGVTGRQLIEHDVDEQPLIVVIFTPTDTPRDHLNSGIAMMKIMIQAELLGLGSCPLSQAVDLVAFRAHLRGQLGGIGLPQMMLRIGNRNNSLRVAPPTPRRGPSTVLDMIDY